MAPHCKGGYTGAVRHCGAQKALITARDKQGGARRAGGAAQDTGAVFTRHFSTAATGREGRVTRGNAPTRQACSRFRVYRAGTRVPVRFRTGLVELTVCLAPGRLWLGAYACLAACLVHCNLEHPRLVHSIEGGGGLSAVLESTAYTHTLSAGWADRRCGRLDSGGAPPRLSVCPRRCARDAVRGAGKGWACVVEMFRRGIQIWRRFRMPSRVCVCVRVRRFRGFRAPPPVIQGQ